MKLKNIFFAIILALITFSACDEIAHPVIPKQIVSILPTTPPAFIDSSATSGTYKYTQYKMLLEVCGGHLCTNCPMGQTDAENVLKSSIEGQVVFMQNEMGPEADTETIASYPDSAFRKVYQCSADSTWFFKFSPNLFPWGLVNRESNWAFALYLNYQDSCNTVIGRAASSGGPAVTIDIHDSCWTNPRIIGATFKVNILKPLTGSFSLETLILEDSISDWQDNNGVYEIDMHRNILRGAFGNNTGGNAWGIAISPTTVNSTFSSFQTYDFTNGENGKAKGWNMAHCYIVAYVFNETTNEVVQAEMIKVE
jgi:hypothetical protein